MAKKPTNEELKKRVKELEKEAVERKHAEEALRESEEKLKEAQRMGKIGHWEFDLDSQKLLWSDQIFEIFKRDKSLGPPDFVENLNHYYPEDAERLQKLTLQAIENGESFEMDYKVKLPSGESAYHFSTFHPFRDETGRVSKLIGTLQDITDRKQGEQEREKLIIELQEAISKIKILSGMLPICSSCKKIRDDKGYWNQIEEYIMERSEAEFSHSICPECMKKVYGDEDWYKKKGDDK